jgi:hypothetical protein
VDPGHFYSDKAPGASLMACVPYGAFFLFKKLSGGELPEVRVMPLDPLDTAAGRRPSPSEMQPGDRLIYNPSHRVALYLSKLGSSVLLSMLGLAAFFLLAKRQLAPGQGAHDAGLATLIYGLATPALAYGTAFYGHQPCADLLLIAFALTILVPRDMSVGRERALGLMIGFSLGLAVATEYPAAIPVLALFGWAAWRRGRQCAMGIALGGLVWIAVLAIYHYTAFGHPLRTGYDFVYLPEFSEGMAERYGLGVPQPEVAFALLFSSYRGLFFASPVLLVAAWGLGRASWASRSRSTASSPSPRRILSRRDYALAIGIFVYYWLLNSGYYMWDGGAAFGPRHMIPALPFLALGLVPAIRHGRFVTGALALISGVHVLLVSAAGPEAPTHGNPIWAYAWPELWSTQAPSAGAATTLGELLGLPGPFSLIPLLALWIWLFPWQLNRKTLGRNGSGNS